MMVAQRGGGPDPNHITHKRATKNVIKLDIGSYDSNDVQSKEQKLKNLNDDLIRIAK